MGAKYSILLFHPDYETNLILYMFCLLAAESRSCFKCSIVYVCVPISLRMEEVKYWKITPLFTTISLLFGILSQNVLMLSLILAPSLRLISQSHALHTSAAGFWVELPPVFGNWLHGRKLVNRAAYCYSLVENSSYASQLYKVCLVILRRQITRKE